MLVLDVDQVEALVTEVGERYRALVLMAAYTGARAGELEALRTDRINWLRRRYHVVESLSRSGDGWRSGRPRPPVVDLAETRISAGRNRR